MHLFESIDLQLNLDIKKVRHSWFLLWRISSL